MARPLAETSPKTYLMFFLVLALCIGTSFGIGFYRGKKSVQPESPRNIAEQYFTQVLDK